jgi:kinesin family protein 23
VFKPDKMNGFELQTSTDASMDRQREQQRISNSQFAQNTPSVNASNKQLKAQTQNELNKLVDMSPRLVSINKDHYFAVFISCIEIYNNYIYDLLDESQPVQTAQSDKESKNLKEDPKGCMYIKDVNECEVKSTEEAFELMNRAQRKRVVAYTDLNAESSRSHSIFTIRIVQSPAGFNNGQQAPIYVSQLSLVDLAGSERTKRTKNTGSRLREAGSINSSLMALRNCMEALRENSLSGTKKVLY